MKRFLTLSLAIAALWAGLAHPAAAQNAKIGKASLHLSIGQKDLLSVEPILATVRLESIQIKGLPVIPGQSTERGTLRFEITPPVKARKNAKPLPLESAGAKSNARIRDFDLYEWFQFPATGTFKIQAVLEINGATVKSDLQTISIVRPAKTDAEFPAMARIHHPPWCNYGNNKFCGDTFDLVKRWPKSRFVSYCQYWNGRFLQNNKQYKDAIARYEATVKQFPKSPLADDAAFGIVECLYAQGNLKAAQQANVKLLQSLAANAKKNASPTRAQTVVHQLALRMTQQIKKNLGTD